MLLRYRTGFRFLWIIFFLGMMAFSPAMAQQAVTSLDWVRGVSQGETLQRGAEFRPDMHPLVQRVLRISEAELQEVRARNHGEDFGLVGEPAAETLYFEVILHAETLPTDFRQPGRWMKATQGVYALRLTYAELRDLADSASFDWLEPALLHETTGNRARAESRADALHQGIWQNTTLTGQGVIAAVFDSGIDVTHPAFRHPEDSLRSRIKYVWDQTLTPQDEEQSPPPPFDYGVLYTRADIEAALATGDGIRSQDSNGHGTHVAGTMAGGGPHLPGMAPEADLVVIKGGNQSFTAFDIISAVQFSASLRETYNRPVVTNFSIGGLFHARDGSEATERAMDAATENPGVMMVTAAGNNGSELRYFGGMAGTDDIILDIPAYTPRLGPFNDRLLVDIWLKSDAPATLRVTTPGGAVYEWEPGSFSGADDFSEGVIEGENFVHAPNGHRRLIFYVGDDDAAFPPASGSWRISIADYDGPFQSWMVLNRVGNLTISQQGATSDFTVTTPGTGKSVLTTGGYVMQNNWLNQSGLVFQRESNPLGSLAFFTGTGPTRDGRLKPEVTAPGRFVAAARSRSSGGSGNSVQPGEDYMWMAGTSMASPVAAGAAALMLQAFPNAMHATIKQAIVEGARTDQFTGEVPHPRWGMGKLDLLGAIAALPDGDALDGVSGLHLWQPGVLNQSGSASMLLNAENGVVYRLPRMAGVLNKVTLHTGVLDFPEGSDPALVAELVELRQDGSRVERAIGNPVRVSLHDIRDFNEVSIDLRETGVFLSPAMETGLRITLDTDRLQPSLLTAELLSRSYSGDGAPAVYRYTAADGMLTSWESGHTLYLDISAVQFPDETTAPPAGYELPFIVALGNNYPNPFNPQTIIPYEIGSQTRVRLTVYDVTGRRIATLADGVQSPGRYDVVFDGSALASGVYLVRLQADGRFFTEKMLLLR
ncbi:Por secretion system C-terminal sorting domain-containing protein [Cyclonatronum proteinivorum]|uniref:Por secretion system C-terminal sorting domain-containing protein n=1 Tax=Cyclonatronum proteinivorum TaxID=1457365 RepID=A0A345UMV6_9BACT|nr:S8 family peptidase [Cyclonatronum proteinivorum]AXJ01808.1 Por secretion system C-terminal sorting domain-containing protein [Cyclonatronum proteinivorum]